MRLFPRTLRGEVASQRALGCADAVTLRSRNLHSVPVSPPRVQAPFYRANQHLRARQRHRPRLVDSVIHLSCELDERELPT